MVKFHPVFHPMNLPTSMPRFFRMPGTIQPLGGETGCDGLERGPGMCFPSQGLRSFVEDLLSNRSRDIYIYVYI